MSFGLRNNRWDASFQGSSLFKTRDEREREEREKSRHNNTTREQRTARVNAGARSLLLNGGLSKTRANSGKALFREASGSLAGKEDPFKALQEQWKK